MLICCLGIHGSSSFAGRPCGASAQQCRPNWPFGGLAIQPVGTEDAKDWNSAVEFAAQDLVKMFHQSIPETSFAFQFKESSGMNDFVAALNRYDASEMVAAGVVSAEVPREMRRCCLPLFGRR